MDVAQLVRASVCGTEGRGFKPHLPPEKALPERVKLFYFNMKFFVYILYSERLEVFYKGHTNNIIARLERHNGGLEKYSKKGIPWKLLWIDEKESKSDAYRLELKLKNLSKKRTIELILKYSDGVVGPDELLFLKQLSGC